jgi:hypothetical protein
MNAEEKLKLFSVTADGQPAIPGSTLYLYPNDDVTREPMRLKVPGRVEYCWFSTLEAAKAGAEAKAKLKQTFVLSDGKTNNNKPINQKL